MSPEPGAPPPEGVTGPAGTGEGDYSRGTFEPHKRYSSVRMQQGRVLLDADWNAAMDLLASRTRTETRDVVGPSGGPEGDAGFGIEVDAVAEGIRIQVGRGRYYVEGLLCENPETVPFQRQADYPQAKLPRLRRDQTYLFYLDAWELLVTAAQDPGLLEVALGGADTTVRTRTVAQVKVFPVAGGGGGLDDEEIAERWRRFRRRAARSGRLRARRVASPDVLGNLLYRVEIHSSGGLYGWPRPLAPGEPVVEAELVAPRAGAPAAPQRLRLSPWPAEAVDPWQPGDEVEVWSDATDRAGAAGSTAAIVALDPDNRTVDLGKPATGTGAAAGERWRVRRIATYKWSRQNASIVAAIAPGGIEPGGMVVTLADPGERGLQLEAGDWVEYGDDVTVLAPRSTPLCRVVEVDLTLLQVTLSHAPVPAGGQVGGHPFLRRWDQTRGDGGGELAAGTPVARAAWSPIEAGIEVAFSGDGPYRARDFWWMPARTRTGDIEWPRVPEGAGSAPAALGPDGVGHRYACLAALCFPAEGHRLLDCRKTFRPLTEGAVSKAGDTMYGPLVIRSHLEVVGGGPGDPGAVTAQVLYGPLGSPQSVGTANLRDRSVTRGKLADDVGTVPPGYSILGGTPEPPPGYAYTGSALTVFHPGALWMERAALPRSDPGPLRGAAAAGRFYVLLESGELWEYDPGADRWRARCSRTASLQGFAVAAAGGKLYAVGGSDARRGKSGAVEIYDPATDRWSAGREMPTPRSHLALAAAGGKLYAVGGLVSTWLGDRATSRNEEYDPAADRWTRRARYPRRRYDLGAGGAAGAVHAFGGTGRPLFGLWGRVMTNAHEEYQPGLDRWIGSRAPLAAPCAHPGVAEIEDRLLLCGGEGALGALSQVEEYDAAAGAWRRRPPLHQPAAWVAAGAVAGNLLAAADAAGCARPPLWELAVASRFWIHRKEQAPEEEVTGGGLGEGGDETAAGGGDGGDTADATSSGEALLDLDFDPGGGA